LQLPFSLLRDSAKTELLSQPPKRPKPHQPNLRKPHLQNLGRLALRVLRDGARLHQRNRLPLIALSTTIR
jgi:hypothetical protein